MHIIHTVLGDFVLKETIQYPNGGSSDFFVLYDTAVIIDRDICMPPSDNRLFAYSMLTNKQNEYMSRYRHVYRFLQEDIQDINKVLSGENDEVEYSAYQNDRSNLAEVSPLEFRFEDAFTDVYGKDSAKYLWKEYGITDDNGHTRYLDYYIRTKSGDIAVEENGVHYHHPQEIGLKRYRDQLNKQNLCTKRGIKLFRFSSEDCGFTDRMEDDIRSYFGADADNFQARGLLVDRSVVLYEHQQNTLEEMAGQRECRAS